MKIPRNEVEYIGRLARLELTEDQIRLFTKQLNRVLDYMEKLDEVGTEGVKPTYQAIDIANALREDTVERSLSKRDALHNAPHKNEDFIIVPKVI